MTFKRIISILSLPIIFLSFVACSEFETVKSEGAKLAVEEGNTSGNSNFNGVFLDQWGSLTYPGERPDGPSSLNDGKMYEVISLIYPNIDINDPNFSGPGLPYFYTAKIDLSDWQNKVAPSIDFAIFNPSHNKTFHIILDDGVVGQFEKQGSVVTKLSAIYQINPAVSAALHITDKANGFYDIEIHFYFSDGSQSVQNVYFYDYAGADYLLQL